MGEPKLRPSITRETKDAWGIEHGDDRERRESGGPKVSKLIKASIAVSGNSGCASLELSPHRTDETWGSIKGSRTCKLEKRLIRSPVVDVAPPQNSPINFLIALLSRHVSLLSLACPTLPSFLAR